MSDEQRVVQRSGNAARKRTSIELLRRMLVPNILRREPHTPVNARVNRKQHMKLRLGCRGVPGAAGNARRSNLCVLHFTGFGNDQKKSGASWGAADNWLWLAMVL